MGQTKKYPWWSRVLKIVLWTAMAAVLLVVGTLVCAVSTLRPEHLTPIVERVANRSLDADVSVGRVELGLRASWPFLTLRVDSLSVVSGAMQRLPADVRRGLPAYADTLLSLNSLSGGINLAALATGEIALSDIVVDGAGVNIAIASDGTPNYAIVAADTTASDTTAMKLPAISLHSFELRNPRLIRYYASANDTHASDSLDLQLRPTSLTDSGHPRYTLQAGGNLRMPMLGEFNLWELPFSVDGDLRWDPADPARLELENVSAGAAFLMTHFSADVDFSEPLTLRSLDFVLDPVRVDTLLSCLPDSVRRSSRVLKTLYTDAQAGVGVRLTSPFNTATDTIPWADVSFDVAPCRVELGRSRLHDVEIRLRASLRGNDMSAASVDIERLHVAGPATDLTLSGTVAELGADPLMDLTLEGYSALGRLPAVLLDYVAGSLQGNLHADFSLKGRPSMFDRNSFHKLIARGKLKADGLYWLADDTVRAGYVRHAEFSFGTNERITTVKGRHADSLLTASIALDSVSYLDHNISAIVTGLHLGVGASNRQATADTTAIAPMGGGLKIATMRVQTITDSGGVVGRDLSGRITMLRYKGESTRPQFDAEINVGRLAAGVPDFRFLLMESNVKAHAHMHPPSARQKRIKHMADSLHKCHPELAMDSVYALALHEYRHRGKHRPRVHPELTADDREIIDWGTSKGLRRLLTDWTLTGSVTAKRAGIYTPVFPLRNRVRNFNVDFSTDSVLLRNVQYKVGHTDLTMTGRVTNIRRALTSRTGRQPLRMDFDLVSDTIDINQLADAVFRGAAYSQRKAAGHVAHMSDLSELIHDDATGEIDLAGTDTVAGPVLIPGNVEAEMRVRANNVMYSDLLLHNLRGTALMMNGRLNFHDFSAGSDVGKVNLSALYSAPTASDMQFGFGLLLNGFNISRFLKMVPAIDSIMPLMRDISGIIDANIAATVDVLPNMDLSLPSLNAAIHLRGDSLRLLDGSTYRTMAKWLMFKDKQKDIIDSMSVELLVDSGMMQLFPFVFNFDRYRLGVQGYNDMALNFDYHVAVLRSPIPFKFGINLKGNPDHFKVRLGKARFNERTAIERTAIVDTTRVNLLRQIEGVFRRGVRDSRIAPLKFSSRPSAQPIDLSSDTLSHADSLALIREGLIPAPEPLPSPKMK